MATTICTSLTAQLHTLPSMPAYFKRHGYTSLGAGKLWHWGAGPGDNWHENLSKFFPNDFQTFIRKERAMQNATVRACVACCV